jgi:hypothetical protein
VTINEIKRHIARLLATKLTMGNYETVVHDTHVVMREMVEHIEDMAEAINDLEIADEQRTTKV